jgi:hypothetical protein
MITLLSVVVLRQPVAVSGSQDDPYQSDCNDDDTSVRINRIAREGNASVRVDWTVKSRCHDTVALAWWTNGSSSVYREMILPRSAKSAVILNLSLEGVGYFVQVNLKSSGSIVVQGDTRSFTMSQLLDQATLPVIGAKEDSSAMLSTPIVVLLAVLAVLTTLAATLLFVRRRKKGSVCKKHGNGTAQKNIGNATRIEMYGEVTLAQNGQALMEDGTAAHNSIPQWPEPPPPWPEPGDVKLQQNFRQSKF